VTSQSLLLGTSICQAIDIHGSTRAIQPGDGLTSRASTRAIGSGVRAATCTGGRVPRQMDELRSSRVPSVVLAGDGRIRSAASVISGCIQAIEASPFPRAIGARPRGSRSRRLSAESSQVSILRPLRALPSACSHGCAGGSGSRSERRRAGTGSHDASVLLRAPEPERSSVCDASSAVALLTGREQGGGMPPSRRRRSPRGESARTSGLRPGRSEAMSLG
jgi:hypothetical protein